MTHLRPTCLPFRTLLSLYSILAAASLRSFPPITLPDGSISGAAVHIVQNNLTTSGFSNDQNDQLAEITARRDCARMASFSLSLNGISTPLKVFPSRSVCHIFLDWDPEASAVLPDRLCFELLVEELLLASATFSLAAN